MAAKNKKTPRYLKKLLKRNCALLTEGDGSFEVMYNILFDREGVMAETSTAASGIIPYTYIEARRDIDVISHAIYDECGDGGFIGLCCDNRPEWLTLFWAILKSGNKPYLVNTNQPEQFTRSMLGTLGAEYVIFYDKVRDFGVKSLIYGDLMAKETDRTKSLNFADEIALSTSGTTLEEKICIYTGKEITEQLLNTKQIVDTNDTITHCYKGDFKVLVMLPLYHIFGLAAAYLWFAMFEGVAVFPENLVPETLLRTIRFHEVTHILSVPLLWHTVEKSVRREIAKRSDKEKELFEKAMRLSMKLQNISPRFGIWVASKLLKEVRAELFGDSVYFCITGGSYIKSSSIELINAIGYPLYNGYGMSEIGIASVDLSTKPKDRIKATIGKPFKSIKFSVDGDGKLLVQGSSVCRKVIVGGTPTFNDNGFDTGDMVSVDEDGRYTVVGRYSDVVISDNGENLNPDIAEKAFELHCAQAYCVLGDENMEKLILVVQLSHEMTAEQIEKIYEEINAGMSSLTPSYRISKVLYTHDPIMGTNEIKVSRAKLRRDIDSGSVTLFPSIEEIRSASAGSPVKDILRSILSVNLEIPEEEISDTANIMTELGGTSLDYLTIVCEINDRFGITLDYEGENYTYSLEDLAKKVEELIEL